MRSGATGELRVVEIIGMDEDAVGERREARGSLDAGADDARLRAGESETLDIGSNDRSHHGRRSRQRQPEAVEDRFLAENEHIVRNIGIRGARDEIGDVLGEPRRLGQRPRLARWHGLAGCHATSATRERD